MESSERPRSRSASATAAEPHDPQPLDATPQTTEPQDAGQQGPQPQYSQPQYSEPQYNEPQYSEPQYNEAPAATSLNPQLTWARPYIDLPAGGPPDGPTLMPRFTPREDAAPAAGPAPYGGQPEGRPAPTDWVPVPPSPPERSGRRQPVRAIIGDEIRVPFIWCEFGTCDATYTHPDALGERDLRARALAAGWRYDALGRRACPSCAQHDPTFWIARPPAPVPGNWRRAV